MRWISLFFLLLSSSIHAHPGGIDSVGGHTNRATGIYHCHRSDCIPPIVFNERPTTGPSRYGTSTSKAMMDIHAFYSKTFYCDCDYNPDKTIKFDSCDYTPVEKYPNRKKIEQEHVVPAHAFGHYRACWNKPDACETSPRKYKGNRECCRSTDDEFKKAEADLHNFRPAIGQINALRSDTPYGLIAGENLDDQIGGCNFEIKHGFAEPRPDIRGDIARIYFYMRDTWDMPINIEQRDMLQSWLQDDPVNDREKEINKKICIKQGNSNPYVEGLTYDSDNEDCL